MEDDEQNPAANGDPPTFNHAFETLCFLIEDETPVEDLQVILQEVKPSAHALFCAVSYAMMGLDDYEDGERLQNICSMEALIQHNPECTKEQNYESATLLHHGCQHGVPFSIIRLLVEHNPDACRLQDRPWKKLPLHHAVWRNKPCTKTIQLLLQHYSDGSLISSYGMLPLHLALGSSDESISDTPCRDDAIALLLDWCPEAASHRTYYENLPLHLACEDSHPISIIMQLVEVYPEAVQTANCMGMLPLHVALDSGKALDDTVTYLVQQYPPAVEYQTNDGDYPLHLARNNHAVNLLMKADPGLVSKCNEKGELPLHRACYSADIATVPLLLQSYPAAAKIQDLNGKLPLHHACSHAENAGHLNLLLEAYPESVAVADNSGRLPLHCSFDRSLSTDVFELVLSRNPDAVNHRDSNGSLPLNLICRPYVNRARGQHDYSVTHIRRLLEIDPSTVIEKDAQGWTPLQNLNALRDRDVPRETKQFLLNTQREVVQAKKQDFKEIGEVELALPDLVVARIWEFLKPDLWEPLEDYM